MTLLTRFIYDGLMPQWGTMLEAPPTSLLNVYIFVLYGNHNNGKVLRVLHLLKFNI